MVALTNVWGILLAWFLPLRPCGGFATHRSTARLSGAFLNLQDIPSRSICLTKTISSSSSSSSSSSLARHMSLTSGYVPPQGDESRRTTESTKKPLYPKAGDLVRYYDLDGGKSDGQVLVGRIRFVQKNMGGEGSGWTLELTEMEDVGQGYYADYGIRQRWAKGSTYRDLLEVSPLSASFVRAEDAYKVPRTAAGRLLVKQEQYDIEGYEGPFADPNNAIEQAVVQADGVLYAALKGKLLRYAALAGAIGTLVCDLTRGSELAAIYFAGFVASLVYLLLLSLKTDTIGTAQASFGKNVSNIRFLMPVLVMIGVAFYNRMNGSNDNSVLFNEGTMVQIVTPPQFAAATVGFLTYRLPLFFIQIEGAFKGEDGETVLPGSAGLAMQLAKQQKSEDPQLGSATAGTTTRVTVLLVSGPQATGRSELVQRLLESDRTKFITPRLLDRIRDGATFERLEQRGEFLSLSGQDNRFGLTKQAILDAGKQAAAAAAEDMNNAGNHNDKSKQIVVVDANLDLAKRLAAMSELRLVGVWVSLSSVKAFEERLGQMVDTGSLPIGQDQTRESVIRNKIREIVKEIEYGISSGLFEFTILNDEDPEMSLQQLLDASRYAN